MSKINKFSRRLPQYEPESLSTCVGGYIGCGSFGYVRRCRHDELGVIAAKMFFMNEDERREDVYNKVEQEANVLSRLHHPNIVQILGITSWCNNVAILMEFVDGENLRFLLSPKQLAELPWKVRVQMAQQMFLAVSYLHHFNERKTFCHGDLKPANILLTQTLQIKLADFGAATLIRASGTAASSIDAETSRVRTARYAAPELLNDPTLKRQPSMDIFSMGIILYELITRTEAYSDWTVPTVPLIVEGQRPTTRLVDDVGQQVVESDEENSIFVLLKQIMVDCWQGEASSRPRSSTVEEKLNGKLKELSGAEVSREIRKIAKEVFSRRMSFQSGKPITLTSLTFPFRHHNEDSTNSSEPGMKSSPSIWFSDDSIELEKTHDGKPPSSDSGSNNSTMMAQGFAFIRKDRTRVKFVNGYLCLFSYEGSFQNEHLWKIVTKPSTSVLVAGKAEKLSLDGITLPTNWEEVEGVVKKCFSGTEDVVKTGPDDDWSEIEEKIRKHATSVAFTLRAGRENQLRDKELKRYDDEFHADSASCTVKTGPVITRGASSSVHGVLEPRDGARVPELLSTTVSMGEIFGRSATALTSYCDKTETWKQFAGIDS